MESKRIATEAEPSTPMPSEEVSNSVLNLGAYDIWAAGIAIVIGGQYFCFNVGLLAGFGSYACATFLLGSSYVVLCVNNAEITSMLPFAGGAYGLARVSLGLYWGFMVRACFLLVAYISLFVLSHPLPLYPRPSPTPLSHAPLPRPSLTPLSHAPLPRPSPTPLTHTLPMGLF